MIGNTMDKVKKALRKDFRISKNWSYKMLMVLNVKKYYQMCSRYSTQNGNFIFKGIKVTKVKILAIIICNKLRFGPHIRNMCEKNSSTK